MRDSVDVGAGCVRMNTLDEEVTAGAQLVTQSTKVGGPAWLCDDFQSRGLQEATDVHGLCPAIGEDAVSPPIRRGVFLIEMSRVSRDVSLVHCAPVGFA